MPQAVMVTCRHQPACGLAAPVRKAVCLDRKDCALKYLAAVCLPQHAASTCQAEQATQRRRTIVGWCGQGPGTPRGVANLQRARVPWARDALAAVKPADCEMLPSGPGGITEVAASGDRPAAMSCCAAAVRHAGGSRSPPTTCKTTFTALALACNPPMHASSHFRICRVLAASTMHACKLLNGNAL
jgi:hypothetical protein